MPDAPERTALYRLYDADQRLLYVGITVDPDARWKRHSMFKWWWPHVARKDVTWLEGTWGEALKAEAEAIRSEKPTFNGAHNYPLVPFQAGEWPVIDVPRGKAQLLAQRIREEIRSGRWESGARIPKRRDIAAASGVSESTAALAYRTLQNEGLLQYLFGLGTFVSNGCAVTRPNRRRAPRTAP